LNDCKIQWGDSKKPLGSSNDYVSHEVYKQKNKIGKFNSPKSAGNEGSTFCEFRGFEPSILITPFNDRIDGV
jgi:hypothetical protein